MRSIYIQLWLGPAAASLIMRMHTRLGGVAIVCDYLHPARSVHIINYVPFLGTGRYNTKSSNPRVDPGFHIEGGANPSGGTNIQFCQILQKTA